MRHGQGQIHVHVAQLIISSPHPTAVLIGVYIYQDQCTSYECLETRLPFGLLTLVYFFKPSEQLQTQRVVTDHRGKRVWGSGEEGTQSHS